MRYPLLDPLRGLAALWVFAHHLLYVACPTDPMAGPWLCHLGYLGVPVFFVVSGYCLTAAAERSVSTGESSWQFLRRRLVRVYPPFWAAVAIGAAVTAAFGPPLGAAELPPLSSYSLADWLGVLTLTHGFRPTGELLWTKYAAVNLAFWTLSLEVQFYVVVTFSLTAGRHFRTVLLAVTVLCLPVMLSPTQYRSGLFAAHWPLFAFGVAVASRKPVADATRPVVGLLGLVLTTVGLWAAPPWPDGQSRMILSEFAFAGGIAGLLAAFRPVAAGPSRWQWLGDLSFPLYLLHVPMMVLADSLVSWVVPVGSVGWVVGVVALCLLACLPFHRYIERPCLSVRPPAGGGGGSSHENLMRLTVPHEPVGL